MIRKEPLARLEAADASPRLESMFSDVRKRLLPSLIRERYRVARAAVDQKSFAAAEPSLAEARRMIAEAEKLGVKDEGLADLSVLVDGFLQLIQSTADQKSAEQPAVVAAAAPAATAPASDGGPARRGLRPRRRHPAPRAAIPRVYSAADEGVSPPVALEQRMPPMSTEMQMITRASKSRGMIDIVIDETGRVIDASVRQSMNAAFDAMIVRDCAQVEVPAGDGQRRPGPVSQDAHPGALTSRRLPCMSSFTAFGKPAFELTSNPRFLFLTAQHREALCNLEYGLSSAKPITVLIGEAGTGKSTLLRAALQSEMCRDVNCVFIDNPTLTRDEFVETLAARFDLGAKRDGVEGEPAGVARDGDPPAVRARRDHGARGRRGAGAAEGDLRGDSSARQHRDADAEAAAGGARRPAGARGAVERAARCGS